MYNSERWEVLDRKLCILETGKHMATQSLQKLEGESLSKARYWISGYEYSSEKYRLSVNCVVEAENVLIVKANYF